MTEWKPPHYKCAKCKSVIFSSFPGEYVSCSCGAISVDQTRHYSRFIGEFKSFLEKNTKGEWVIIGDNNDF